MTKRLLVAPRLLRPSRDDFEVVGTFNPGVVLYAGRVQMLVRVAERPLAQGDGKIGLPRWDADSRLHIDWFGAGELTPVDARVTLVKATGEARLTSVSHLRLLTADVERLDQADAYREEPIRFLPADSTETWGVEDPRITPMGDRFYLTYVAVSRHGACTALASTRDFRSFERHGIIFPCENKDVLLFPQPINDRYFSLHRPVSATPFGTPEIWLASSPDLIHWGHHRPLKAGREPWQSGRVGGGVPPLRTAAGWLEIFHGNRRPGVSGDIGEYCAGGMLLESEDPGRVLAASKEPWMTPTESFEREGFVPGVVFPTAAVSREGKLAIFYGAADMYTAVATYRLADLEATLDFTGQETANKPATRTAVSPSE